MECCPRLCYIPIGRQRSFMSAAVPSTISQFFCLSLLFLVVAIWRFICRNGTRNPEQPKQLEIVEIVQLFAIRSSLHPPLLLPQCPHERRLDKAARAQSACACLPADCYSVPSIKTRIERFGVYSRFGVALLSLGFGGCGYWLGRGAL